jgi:hypothetical protein
MQFEDGFGLKPQHIPVSVGAVSPGEVTVAHKVAEKLVMLEAGQTSTLGGFGGPGLVYSIEPSALQLLEPFML